MKKSAGGETARPVSGAESRNKAPQPTVNRQSPAAAAASPQPRRDPGFAIDPASRYYAAQQQQQQQQQQAEEYAAWYQWWQESQAAQYPSDPRHYAQSVPMSPAPHGRAQSACKRIARCTGPTRKHTNTHARAHTCTHTTHTHTHTHTHTPHVAARPRGPTFLYIAPDALLKCDLP
jgi:hypothetical protein